MGSRLAQGRHPDVPAETSKDTAAHSAPKQAAPEPPAPDVTKLRVIWARLTPSPIPPGAVAEFSATLANPLPRPMKLQFQPESGELLTTVIRNVEPPNIEPPLAITAIGFSRSLDTVYVYLEANAPEPLTLRGFELDGQWVHSGLWLSADRLAKGQKAVAVLQRARPLVQGDWITVKALATDGTAAAERVRVFAGFPISVEEGAPPAGFGLDPDPYTEHPKYLESRTPPGPPSNFPAASFRCLYLFSCAMHSFGLDKQRTAREILRRFDLAASLDPRQPAAQSLCRIRPETGYSLFGQITDILRANPYITTGLSRGREGEPPEETCARIARYAYLSVRPRPVHAIVETAPFGQREGFARPDEFRRQVYTVLAQGARGILYRHGAWNDPKPEAQAIVQEIKKLNAELAQVRDLLAIADPLSWPDAPVRDGLRASALLAGDKALLLILVRPTPPKQAPTAQPSTVKLAIPVLQGLTPQEPALIAPDGPRPLPEFETDPTGRFLLNIPVPGTAALYLIPLGRKPQ